jgi:predicted dehydrogenase
MAQAYAAVLRGLGVPHMALCRSESSAEKFRQASGAPCHSGGLAAHLASQRAPAVAIVAAPVSELASCTENLIEAGCGRILVEKPGGTTAAQVSRAAALAAARGARVYVGHNRRFFASVRKAREMIATDGGVTSFTFEFSELGDRVGALPYPAEVLANWELANSTHVIDTAFFLGGRPARIEAMTGGTLAWHPRCARYAGHGVTTAGALFSFSADWDAPGRWGIDINTRQTRLVLRPMETLQRQRRGTFALEDVVIDDTLDRSYKAGLYRQTAAFITGEDAGDLLDVAAQADALALVTRSIMREA